MTFFSPWRFERSSRDKRSSLSLPTPFRSPPQLHPSRGNKRGLAHFPQRNLGIVSNKGLFLMLLSWRSGCLSSQGFLSVVWWMFWTPLFQGGVGLDCKQRTLSFERGGLLERIDSSVFPWFLTRLLYVRNDVRMCAVTFYRSRWVFGKYNSEGGSVENNNGSWLIR